MRHDLPADRWVKSSYSGNNGGQCVELQAVADGVALGDSKDRSQGAFVFTRAEITAFIQAAKDGEFDNLV